MCLLRFVFLFLKSLCESSSSNLLTKPPPENLWRTIKDRSISTDHSFWSIHCSCFKLIHNISHIVNGVGLTCFGLNWRFFLYLFNVLSPLSSLLIHDLPSNCSVSSIGMIQQIFLLPDPQSQCATTPAEISPSLTWSDWRSPLWRFIREVFQFVLCDWSSCQRSCFWDSFSTSPSPTIQIVQTSLSICLHNLEHLYVLILFDHFQLNLHILMSFARHIKPHLHLQYLWKDVYQYSNRTFALFKASSLCRIDLDLDRALSFLKNRFSNNVFDWRLHNDHHSSHRFHRLNWLCLDQRSEFSLSYIDPRDQFLECIPDCFKFSIS